jgi:tRNA-binding protein
MKPLPLKKENLMELQPAHLEKIQFADFLKVDIRAGTIVGVEDYPEARKPAYKLEIDFGELGKKRSSAQITHHYRKEDLIGKQIIAVVNFPPKQIGKFMSEVLTLGLPDKEGMVVLLEPTVKVPNGCRLF